MPQRRKYELLIADLRRQFAAPSTPGRYDNLWQMTWNLKRFHGQLAGDVGKVRQLIAVARIARTTAGPGSATAEEAIMKCMEDIVRECRDPIEEVGALRVSDEPAVTAPAPELRPTARVVTELSQYALECFQFTARPRDVFAGARRGLAFNILGAASRMCAAPASLELAHQALRQNRSQEVRGAINFLGDYFKARAEMPVPEDIVEGLLVVAEKSNSRSTATGALNVLVETGQISELEACDRIADWKAEHDR